MKTSELIEQRAALVGRINTAGTKVADAHAKNDDDRFAEGMREQRAAQAEMAVLDSKIAEAEQRDAADRREQGTPINGGEFDRELRNYSLANAIGGALAGRLTGREAEIDQELKRGRESRSGASGIHLAVPSEILLGGGMERRDGQTVNNNPAGGWTVGTDIAALGDRFRPALKVEAMGATVLRGLTSFLELPNLAKSGSVKWVGENQNSTRSAVEFNSVSMGPKTVTGEYRLSRRLMLQSAVAIESVLRRDLGFLLSQALDSAAINGDGVLAPQGILGTTGVEKVTTETDFSDTTANLISELELDDVTGTAAFLTNPLVMKSVRKIKDADEHVIPGAELFHNQRVEVTTQVPKNIGAGNDKSALIYGLWSELYLGYWSAVDILINPYHPDVASNGGALLHAFLDADVAVRHPNAFVYAEI